MKQNLGNLDTHGRKSGPLDPEQREKKQQRFLKAFCESGNIKASCKAAGIDRQTFYNWRDHDAAFKAQLPEAQLDANDTLEFAAYERAVKGIESFVVSSGQIVYEYLPDLDDVTGIHKRDDKGKLLYKRGKPLVERKYSDSLLQTLLKANMPDKYKDRNVTELVGLAELLDSEHASLLGDLEALPDASVDQKQTEAGDTGSDPVPPGTSVPGTVTG